MRIGKRGFRARVKSDLHIEFGDEQLTSYAGLELVQRFVRGIGLRKMLLGVERRLGLTGDLGLSALVLLVVAMLITGARRLAHVSFLANDPLVRRFCGLRRLPSERTLSRSLKKLTWRTWPALDAINTRIVAAGVMQLDLPRWTLDMDGTVLTTGLSVERATRGFNPHHRKNPSYYPITLMLAQTNHVIGHKNRTGGVHDSHQSGRFLRDNVRSIRTEIGFRGLLEFRADAAFFHRQVLESCDSLGLEYAIRVPMWPWLNIRGVVKKQRKTDWTWVDRAKKVQGLFVDLPIGPWDRTERVAIYRKAVNHEPVKGQQLDLFNPDDGYWEYSAVCTNKSLQLQALWHFFNGRGVQEKVIGELKSGYAFGDIPTKTYSANTAWQKLNVLAHNLMTTLQLVTTAEKKDPTPRRTTLFLLRSISTLRFEWLVKAARVLRPAGRHVLRLANNSATQNSIAKIQARLDQAA